MELTADHRELQDLVRCFFAEHVSSEYLRKRIESGARSDGALIETLSQLGLREGFCGPDAALSVVELSLVAQECGRVLMPEPVWERLLCEGLVERLLAESEAKELIAFLGDARTALAPQECCSLSCDAKGKVLSGDISWATGGMGAGRVFAVATIGKSSRVVCFNAAGAGVKPIELPSLDLSTALTGYAIKKEPCLVLSEGASMLLLDLVEILKASEAYGITSRVIEFTTEYVKTREQFGVPVGGFQAIQHKLADCYSQSEALGALARFSAWSVDHSPEQRPLTARSAMSQAAQVAPHVCEVAMQCHGGIGFTWEYELHLFLRRAKLIQMAFPNSEQRAGDLIARAR